MPHSPTSSTNDQRQIGRARSPNAPHSITREGLQTDRIATFTTREKLQTKRNATFTTREGRQTDRNAPFTTREKLQTNRNGPFTTRESRQTKRNAAFTTRESPQTKRNGPFTTRESRQTKRPNAENRKGTEKMEQINLPHVINLRNHESADLHITIQPLIAQYAFPLIESRLPPLRRRRHRRRRRHSLRPTDGTDKHG